MRGGHYNYLYRQITLLADKIEGDFLRDGKCAGRNWQTGEPVEADLLAGTNPDQRQAILTEVRSLITDLRRDAGRAKELEWYLSGDTSADTYLERLTNIK